MLFQYMIDFFKEVDITHCGSEEVCYMNPGFRSTHDVHILTKGYTGTGNQVHMANLTRSEIVLRYDVMFCT